MKVPFIIYNHRIVHAYWGKGVEFKWRGLEESSLQGENARLVQRCDRSSNLCGQSNNDTFHED